MKREAIGIVVFSVIAALGVTQLPESSTLPPPEPTSERDAAPPPCDWIPGDPHVVARIASAGSSATDAFTLSELTDVVPSRGLEYVSVFTSGEGSAVTDPAFGTGGFGWLVGIERTFPQGPVTAIGVALSFDDPRKTIAGLESFANDIHRTNGVVVLARAEASHWDVQALRALNPDAIEVWRGGPFAYRTPGLEKNPERALEILDGLLDHGRQLGIVGGSDTPSRTLSDVAGPGEPTTWVCAETRESDGIVQAIRDGRTTVSHETPQRDGPLLVLEGDQDGDGTFEEQMGDSVPPGTTLRVSIRGAPAARLRVVGSGSRVVKSTIVDSFEYEMTFDAPQTSRWLRAELYVDETLADEGQRTCPDPVRLESSPGDRADYCGGLMPMLAISSPIYVDD